MSNLLPQRAAADQPPVPAQPVVRLPNPPGNEHLALETKVATLLARGKNGAHWFYWVAALSLVNSVIILAGGQFHFVIGLGVTAIVDALAAVIGQQNPEIGPILKGIALVFALGAAAIVALFGWLSAKRYTIAMGIGMVLYLLDGALYLLLGDFFSAGFHAFALYCMWNGLQAHRELAELEKSLAAAQPLPPAPIDLAT
jgi:hypothetical protein